MKDYKPHPYQKRAYVPIMENTHYALFLDMGLGKTVITLTAIVDLFLQYKINKVLIVAPLRVANKVWAQEAQKWMHTSFLKFSICTGNIKKRKQALEADAQVYVINRENVKWLCEEYNYVMPFDMLVIDELSSFKSHDAQRFKALKLARTSFSRILGLTGTPMSNGYMDLWAQIFLLDGGIRLHPYITRYRNEFFTQDRVGSSEYAMGYELIEGMDTVINERIADIVLTMKTEDYLDLPSFNVIDIDVELPEETFKRYKEFEKTKIFEFMDAEVSATSAGSLSGKLLQYANGACYYEVQVAGVDNNDYKTERKYLTVHDHKIDALLTLIEKADGKPLLVAYQFKSDLERLLLAVSENFPKLNVAVLNNDAVIDRWNNKEINVMFAHAMSAGHGLNLQFGGDTVVWFGLTWSLELYQQFNKRLHRQGITKPVTCYRILCPNTYDDVVRLSIDEKANIQDLLMIYIKQYHNL